MAHIHPRYLPLSVLGIALGAVLGVLWASFVYAVPNISTNANEHWAWSDSIGWLDFLNPPAAPSVDVASTGLTGYANSSVGPISLYCGSTGNPDGTNFCGVSNYQVINDGTGRLEGWGWNDAVGWVSFCGGEGTTHCPGTVLYRTLISPATGDFSEWAWNDIVGWISFNCNQPAIGSYCGTSNHKVNTLWRQSANSGWLDSVIFDTRAVRGAQPNSILWRGSLPSGTNVKFQIATDCLGGGTPPVCPGVWNFVGPDNTASSFYTSLPSTPGGTYLVRISNYADHGNKRYVRYKVILESDVTRTASPRVDDIIVNWSP